MSRRSDATGSALVAPLVMRRFPHRPPDQWPFRSTGRAEIVDLALDGYPCPAVTMDDATTLQLVSTITTFGAPRDIALAEFSIEAFYPGDPATRTWLDQHTANPDTKSDR